MRRPTLLVFLTRHTVGLRPAVRVRSWGSSGGRQSLPTCPLDFPHDRLPDHRHLSNRAFSTTTTSSSTSDPASRVDPETVRHVMRRLAHNVVVCTSALPGARWTGPAARTTWTARDLSGSEQPRSEQPRSDRSMSDDGQSTTATQDERPSRTSRPAPVGMTMTSFTTLTLEPTPLVTFNIKRPSRTLDAIRATGHFAIHLLHANADGARTAEWFARAQHNGADQEERFAAETGCVWRTHAVSLGDVPRAGRPQEDHRQTDHGPATSRQDHRQPDHDPTSSRQDHRQTDHSPAISRQDHQSVRGQRPPVVHLEGQGILAILHCRLLARTNDYPHGGLIDVPGQHTLILGQVLHMTDPGHGHGHGHGYGDGPELGLTYVNRQYRHVGQVIQKHRES